MGCIPKYYWTIIKDGKPEPNAFKSKRSLLISYDLMPLIGLRNMERRLISKGKIPTRVKIKPDNNGDFWVCARNGVLDLSFESLSISEEGAFSQAAMRENLQWFVFSKTSNICPKRTKRVRVKTINELKHKGIEAIRVSVTPIER